MEIALRDHFNALDSKVAARAAGRIGLYLDTKYWIRCRHAEMDSSEKTTADMEILNLVRKGVRDGKFVTPISWTSIRELGKQGDPATRGCMASLMDEFSLGVAVCPQDERINKDIEIAMLNGRDQMQGGMPTRVPNYFTAPYFASQYRIPVAPGISLGQQKEMIELAYRIDVKTMMADQVHHQAFMHMHALTGEVAKVENFLRKTYGNQVTSFKKAVQQSSEAAAVLYGEATIDVFIEHYARQTENPVITDADREESVRIGKNMIKNVGDLAQGRILSRAISGVVLLGAHLAWNKGKIVTANDLMDYEHANAALATCSRLFTEDGLSHVCNIGPVKISDKFNIKTASKPDDVISQLKDL